MLSKRAKIRNLKMHFYIRFQYKKLKLKTMKITNTRYKKILNENLLIYGTQLVRDIVEYHVARNFQGLKVFTDFTDGGSKILKNFVAPYNSMMNLVQFVKLFCVNIRLQSQS